MSDNKPKVLVLANTFWNLYNFRSGVIKELLSSGFEVIALAQRDKYCPNLLELGCQVRVVSIDAKGINPIKDLLTIIKIFLIFIQL
jgi:hypothetical protein